MTTVQCGYCLKHVRNKPLFGTLHFCLTTAEIERVLVGRRMLDAQKNARPIAGTLGGITCRVPYSEAGERQ